MSVTALAGGPGLPGDTAGELDADLAGSPAYRVRFSGGLEPLDALDSALPTLSPSSSPSPSAAGSGHAGPGHQGGHGPSHGPSHGPGHGPGGSQYSITGLLQSLGAADCGLASLGGLGGLGGLGSMVQSEQPPGQHGQQHLAFSKLGEQRDQWTSTTTRASMAVARRDPRAAQPAGQHPGDQLLQGGVSRPSDGCGTDVGRPHPRAAVSPVAP